MIELPFDRIVCINLDRRKDRWEAFLSSATRWIPQDRIIRFSAMDATRLIVPSWWNGTPGGHACTLSHRFALAEAAAMGVASVLIFEDDALLADDFGPRLERFMSAVPEDWQILYLGGQHGPRFSPYPVVPGVVRCRRTIRMHAYVVRGVAIPAVHDHIARVRKICDQALADYNPKIPAYAPEKFMVAQRASFSDVESRLNERDRWWN